MNPDPNRRSAARVRSPRELSDVPLPQAPKGSRMLWCKEARVTLIPARNGKPALARIDRWAPLAGRNVTITVFVDV